MGRSYKWLKDGRTEMVAILREIERQSPYTRDDSARGGLTLLLARLARVAAGPGEEPRSISAMRQAWWRWTTSGPQGSTPPVMDLARLVRYARELQWLTNIDRRSRALEERLLSELATARTKQRREMEREWKPAVREAVWGLFDHLEAQLEQLDTAVEGYDGIPAVLAPPADFVQQQVQTMVETFVARVFLTLKTPRDIFEAPQDGDEFVRPYELWPAALRSIARRVSDVLNDSAAEIETMEQEGLVDLAPTEPRPRRMNLFRRASGRDDESQPV